jgi:hypothetical protein
MADSQQQDPKEVQKLIDLYQQVDRLTRDQAENMAKIDASAGNVTKKIGQLQKELYSIEESFDSIATSLKSSVQEFSKYNSVASNTKKTFNSIQSIASKLLSDQSGLSRLSEKELKNLRSKLNLDAQNLKANLQSKLLTLEQATETDDVLRRTADLVRLLEKRIEKEKEIEKAIGLTGNALKGLSKIPGIGSALKTEEAIEKMRNLADTIQDQGKNINSFSNKLKIAGVGLKTAFSGIKESLTDPVSIITFIITQALKANSQTVELGKALGRSSEQYRENLASIARSSTNINVTTENLVGAFNELAQATGFASEFTADQLETQVLLTKQVGLQADEAANVQKFAVLTGKTSEETYKSFIKGLVATRNQLKVGINFKATLAEALKVSGQLAANLENNPERIAKAIVTAKAFGMTLEQVSKSGESLLNFESSIESELKAELLTGKQLNLERARAAALAGDQISLAEELAKNVGTAAEFTKMNVLQQKALAESVGMTADELANTLKNREQAIASGKSLAQVTEEEAQKAIERQNIQDKFNQSILKLQDFFGNLVAGPVGQLLDSLTKIIGLVTDVLQPVLNVAFKPLVWAVGLLGEMEGLLKGIVATAVIYKGVQLGINIAKASRVAIMIQEAAIEKGILSTQNMQYLLGKQSLATKIVGYTIIAKQLVVENAKKAAIFTQNVLEKAGLAIKQIALLLTTKEAWKSIAGAAMSAFESAAKIPFIGWALGGAAAAGAIVLGASLMSKGDDVMSEGGYGKRTLLAPEGAIKLNDKDTVIAGTNLGGGQQAIQGPSIDLTPMIVAINEVKAAVDGLMNRPVVINMDGKQVGSNLVQGSYKLA